MARLILHLPWVSGELWVPSSCSRISSKSTAPQTSRRSASRYLRNGCIFTKTKCSPEANVVRKDGELYYAFFAHHWKGSIELRGLRDGTYHIVDYVNNKDLGIVHGP